METMNLHEMEEMEFGRDGWSCELQSMQDEARREAAAEEAYHAAVNDHLNNMTEAEYDAEQAAFEARMDAVFAAIDARMA